MAFFDRHPLECAEISIVSPQPDIFGVMLVGPANTYVWARRWARRRSGGSGEGLGLGEGEGPGQSPPVTVTLFVPEPEKNSQNPSVVSSGQSGLWLSGLDNRYIVKVWP